MTNLQNRGQLQTALVRADTFKFFKFNQCWNQ